jgi:hypothetical protein
MKKLIAFLITLLIILPLPAALVSEAADAAASDTADAEASDTADNPPDSSDLDDDLPSTEAMIEELYALIEDEEWFLNDLIRRIEHGVQPEMLELAQQQNVPYKLIKDHYLEGFVTYGRNWDRMFTDLHFRAENTRTARSAGDPYLIDDYMHWFITVLSRQPYWQDENRRAHAPAMSGLEKYNRDLLHGLHFELLERRLQVIDWELELFELEERDELEIFEKEVERAGLIVGYYGWIFRSLQEVYILRSRYTDVNVEMAQTLWERNSREFSNEFDNDWERMFTDAVFRDRIQRDIHIIIRQYLGPELSYSGRLWNAYSEYESLLNLGARVLMEEIEETVTPLEYEYMLIKLPYLRLLAQLNASYEQRGDVIPIADKTLLQLETYQTELFILKYETLIDPDGEAVFDEAWANAERTFRELEQLAGQDRIQQMFADIEKFKQDYAGLVDEVWLNRVIELYEDYLRYSAQAVELSGRLAGRRDRIAELEELIRKLMRGMVYMQMIYDRIIELRDALAEADRNAAPHLTGFNIYDWGMTKSLEAVLPRVERDLQFQRSWYDAEELAIMEQGVQSMRESLSLYKYYPEPLRDLFEELFEDYLNELRFNDIFIYGVMHENYITALETYLPFMTFEDMAALYYFTRDKGVNEINALIWYGSEAADKTLLRRLLDDYRKYNFAIRGYIFTHIVNKFESGVLLTQYEMDWYHYYLSRFPGSPGIPEAEYLANLPYTINVALLSFVETLIGFFEIAAGTAVMSYNGEPMKLFDAFFRAPAISAAFWGVTLISFALALFFSIITVVRQASDLKGEKTMGSVLRQIGRTMLMLLIVPAFIIGSIQLVATVMEQTDRMFEMASGTDSVTRAVFAMSTLNAGIGEPDGSMGSLQAPARRMFLSGELDYKNQAQVSEHFRLGDIDIGISVLVAVLLIVLYIALICIFILRIFYLILLYVISPLFVSSIAADDGKIFRKWRDLFIAKLLTGFGLVIAVKLLVYILPPVLSGQIRLGPDGFSSVIINFMFIIGSVYAVLKSGGMVSKIIYPEGESDEDMVIGEMKEKALWAYNKAKEIAKAAVKLAVNTGRLLISGDASGLVKQAAETAIKAGQAAAGAVQQVAEGSEGKK